MTALIPPEKRPRGGKIKMTLVVRDFSESTPRQQDRAVKWLREVAEQLLRSRKHIYHHFMAEN